MGKPAISSEKILAFVGSSLAAGASIGLGGWIYSTLLNAGALGAFFGSLGFSLGIILVCVCGFFLYTGKIGTVSRGSCLGEKFAVSLPKRAALLALMFVCNVAAAMLLGLLASMVAPEQTRIALQGIAAKKAEVSEPIVLWKSVVCGALVYAGVSLYNKFKGGLGVFLVAVCIAAFVLLGFDHCIANAFYFGTNFEGYRFGSFSKTVLLCAVGNSVGAIVSDFARRGLSLAR